ncbi:MAG: hypothetical protein KDN22_18085 [Verrucomicrobiae bacterium]|nr:hypothetical protein [Verrucomicrobiae bacterium]
MQYRAVIIVWTDKLSFRNGDSGSRARDRRLLYVCMTRAVSFLALTASGDLAPSTRVCRRWRTDRLARA